MPSSLLRKKQSALPVDSDIADATRRYMNLKRPPVDIRKIHSVLEDEFVRFRMPVVDIIELQTKDPFKVLVTTILSARTKDETTTRAARRLFSFVKNMSDLDKLPRQARETHFSGRFFQDQGPDA